LCVFAYARILRHIAKDGTQGLGRRIYPFGYSQISVLGHIVAGSVGSVGSIGSSLISIAHRGGPQYMTNSVALVTGASSGIGKAAAIRLARDFSSVVLVAREDDKLAQVAQSARAEGSECLCLAMDLSVTAAAQAVIQRTLERFGRIDALVNIAGAVAPLDVFQMTDAQWDIGMELKFHAARRLAIHAWEALRAAKGSIVFISGNAADIPMASSAAVGAINAAIEALAKAFADRGIEDGVQVNAVSPGAILTGRRLAMLERAAVEKKISLEDMKSRFLKQARVSRFGEPEDIAELVAFIVSPKAKYMTGAVLRMDGGEVKSK
jgi:3-oxoacyl-[acyl-carrier protein] reductase